MGFVWPLPNDGDLQKLYRWKEYGAVLYDTLWVTNRRRARILDSILDGVESLTPPGGRRLLDLGCGYGYFLQRAAIRGWAVQGVEWDAETARRTRDRLHVPVVAADGLAAISDLGSYELIMMSHWLEHIRQPGEALSEVARHLLPAGLAVLRLPDTSSFLARKEGTSWSWYCPPVHLFYFRPESIPKLASRAALDVVAVTTLRGDAHLWWVEFGLSLAKRLKLSRVMAGRRTGSNGADGRLRILNEARRIVEVADAAPFEPDWSRRLSAQEMLVVLRRGLGG